MSQKDNYISALCKELSDRKEFLKNDIIETVYLGGGTPSQLSGNDFEKIFDQLNKHYNLANIKEVTIEINPDDINEEYIIMLKRFPFNRISLGIQSFDDNDLKFLNRRHDSGQAIKAIKLLQKNGYDNISIDLMYGLPNQTIEKWQNNLDTATSLDIQHISSYHLIYEEGTAMYRLLENGNINPVKEEISLEMFKMLISHLKNHGFIHYEISNFAKEGFHSLHNSSYLTGEKYLGLGASAHSFDLSKRSWNPSDLSIYISGNYEPEYEELSLNEKYNDYILTSLRTIWGLNLDILKERFGNICLDYCLENSKKYIDNGLLIIDQNIMKISPDGIFISDGIMSDLMIVD